MDGMSDPIKLTEARVRDLPVPLDKHDWYRDTMSPLSLLVTPGDARTFYVQRRVNGRPTRVRIGRWPDVTLDQARRQARVVTGTMTAGADPRKERDEQRKADAERAYTVARAVADYCGDAERGLKRKRPLKATTIAEYRRIGDTALKPLAALPLADVTGKHLDGLRRNLTASNANAALRLLRAACNHAADRDVVAVNPFAGRKRQVVDLTPRKSHVPRADLGRFIVALHGLQAEGVPAGEMVGGDALLLMLWYGLRKNEALSLPAADVDLAGMSFTVVDTKNSDPLTLPITPVARPLFARRLALATGLASPWLFPSVGNRVSAAGWLREPRRAVDRVTAATGIAFTPHDLRRSFASVAASRLPHAAIKRVLNHRQGKSADITTDYIQVGVDDLRGPLAGLHDELEQLAADAGRNA